jgi:hypothetical protein
MPRGSFGFEVSGEGAILDTAANVERLGGLWLDRSRIAGELLGDGDPGDFDFGAWHIACHLVAASGVRRAADGRLLWLEVSHNSTDDGYTAAVTARDGDGISTWPISTDEGRRLLACSTLLGFVEGNSVGRISARGIDDPPTLFNGWRRQDFDQPTDLTKDGGRVWEHWCTTRDIRSSSRIGISVLSAYLSLVANLRDLFPAVVARGRSGYSHPAQLCALVESGFIGEPAALSDLIPTEIPPTCESLLLHATPVLSLQAAEALDWQDPPRYYMFARRIDQWCPAAVIRDQLSALRR